MKKTALVTAIVALVVSVLAVGASARTTAPTRSAALAPEVEAALALLPQGEMTTVIVTLRERANLAAVKGTTRANRLKAVIAALQSRVSTSQGGIRALLRRRAAQGKVANTTPFWVVNGISVTATADVIRELALFPAVESVTSDDVPVVPTAGAAEPNVAAAAAPALWDLGYKGQGVVVANLDSGVDLSHPDLAARWRGGTNSWFDPYGQHPASPVDLTGHGTGTMGVMVGGDAGGTAIGVAPGAKWIAARIFNDKGASTATAIHAAFQWVLDPDGDPNTADAPNVVNNSWSYGYAGTCNLAFQPDVQALRAAGIVPVFAAGNFGPGTSTSVSPANYPESLAVGAVNNADQIYSGSSRGPSKCGETSTSYPEIVAPGVNIRTAGRYGTYQSLSGTSLAAPHVAGALALLLSADPNLTPAAQEQALEQGAHDLGAIGVDNVFGFGRLDILAALGGGGTSVADFGVSAVPSSVSVTAGGSAGSSITVSSLNGFSDAVALSVSGLPGSASAAFSPAVVSGGAGVSQLTVSTSQSIAAGTYPLTITGSSGASSHTVGVSLVVTSPPDFGVSAVPSSVSVTAGGSAGSSITVSSLNGFSDAVALSVSGLPGSASAAFSPAVVSGGAGVSQLTVSTSQSIAAGTYPLTITGSSGASSHTVGVSLVVTSPPDFGVSAVPSSVSVTAGGSAGSSITVSSLNGFSDAVALSVSGLPGSASAAFSPAVVSGGAGVSQLTVSTSQSIAAGTYPLTITGSSGARTHSTQVTLVVVPAAQQDFTLDVTPSTAAVRRNSQTVITVLVGSIQGSSSAVTLSVSGLPSRVTASFSKNPVAPGGQATLALVAARNASTGTFTITIRGTGGGKTHTTTATLTVTR